MQEDILIIQTAFIGDVVLATALIENLHAEFPAANIDFLVRKGNESLLTGHPHLREVLVWDKTRHKNRNLLRMLFYIRKKNYSRVINVQRYASTGMLTAFSGAKETVGFDKNPLSLLFTRKIPHVFGRSDESLHETQRNHELIRHITIKPFLKPKLYPGFLATEKANRLVNGPFITISPASVWFTKQFPPQRWAAFINQLPDDSRVYLLGGKGDRSLSEAIIQMTLTKAPVNLCGELSFLESAALMKKANMNFVNDSAPMHFASAVNAPVAVVYCSTIPAFGYGPLSDIKFIIEKKEPLYCRPCGLHGYSACPQHHFRCAMDIDDEQLLSIPVGTPDTPTVPGQDN